MFARRELHLGPYLVALVGISALSVLTVVVVVGKGEDWITSEGRFDSQSS